jgi:hypothetical protein
VALHMPSGPSTLHVFLLHVFPHSRDLHAQVQQAEDTSGDDSEWESASDEEESIAAAAGAGDDTPEAADSAAGQADSEMPDSSEWAEWDVRRRCAHDHGQHAK